MFWKSDLQMQNRSLTVAAPCGPHARLRAATVTERFHGAGIPSPNSRYGHPMDLRDLINDA
jgi:hypothetical protein